MKTINVLLWAAILALAAPTAVSGEITVVFIPKITGNAFFESANEGAQRYAEKIGFKVDYLGSRTASLADQIAIVEDAVARRVDAICVSSLDAVGLDDALRKARNAGVQVTTWDSDVSGDARSIMVSQGTPDILGRMLVDMGVKSLRARGKDPEKDPIRYVWHYSQAQVADQNSWRIAGEKYIRERFPAWLNINAGNYYSEQDPKKALDVGEEILAKYPDIDLIICNDSTALPGQCQAMENFGFSKEDVTITGFSAPNAIKDYCHAGIIERWGLWDCQVQGALGCYMAYYLASGNKVKVGDKITAPEIGELEILPNTVLDAKAYTAADSGVVLLPERLEFTMENMNKYNF